MLDFKLYYRTTAIKTAWYWCRNRHKDEWNRIEVPYINSWSYRYPVFDKEAQNICWRKDSLFDTLFFEVYQRP
jgi:hypothetical protein